MSNLPWLPGDNNSSATEIIAPQFECSLTNFIVRAWETPKALLASVPASKDDSKLVLGYVNFDLPTI
jgi:hypothetical protein